MPVAVGFWTWWWVEHCSVFRRCRRLATAISSCYHLHTVPALPPPRRTPTCCLPSPNIPSHPLYFRYLPSLYLLTRLPCTGGLLPRADNVTLAVRPAHARDRAPHTACLPPHTFTCCAIQWVVRDCVATRRTFSACTPPVSDSGRTFTTLPGFAIYLLVRRILYPPPRAG